MLVKYGFYLYGIFLWAYILNKLISVLPLNNSYSIIRSNLSVLNGLRFFYKPIVIWFTPTFMTLSTYLKARYISIFIFSAIIFLTSSFEFLTLTPFMHCIFFSMLLVSFFTDIEHQIIPNEMTFGLILLGLIHSVLTATIYSSLKGIGLTILVFLVFSLIIYLIGQSHAFGAGDIKLCVGISAFTGWQITSIMLYFTFLIGGFAGLYFLFIKKKSKHAVYPFAPVILLGLIIAFMFTNKIYDHYYPWINNSFKVEVTEQTKLLPRP
jgi:prepilin signal peptidase PulO-like enzyme (type II secretory pathway)